MRLDEPSWWYRSEPSALARALRPLSAVYGWAARRRMRRATPYRSKLPVICVGNLVAGGTGKTPLTIVIASALIRTGERPAILTRGYGGRSPGPRWVDPTTDCAADVGDEALLLAEHAPTLVARDRVAGAAEIETAKTAYSVIVMDDGLQNPSLAKDLRIAVVDARRGIGNGEVIPAGPLRAPLAFQLDAVDAVLVNHPPAAANAPASEITAWLKQNFHGPVLEARTRPEEDTDWVAAQRVVAFAGIANPQRFFNLLQSLGAEIAATVTLPDHHAFAERDAERILALARDHDALPVTTEKDRVRLWGVSGQRGELWQQSRAVGIRLIPDERDAGRLGALLNSAISAHSTSR